MLGKHPEFWEGGVRCHDVIRWCRQTALESGNCEIEHTKGGGCLADSGKSLSKVSQMVLVLRIYSKKFDPLNPLAKFSLTKWSRERNKFGKAQTVNPTFQNARE